jgi:hypothetical protein
MADFFLLHISHLTIFLLLFECAWFGHRQDISMLEDKKAKDRGDAANQEAPHVLPENATSIEEQKVAQERQQDEDEAEKRKTGAVALSTYSLYLKSTGKWLSAWVFTSLVLMQLSRNAGDAWLSKWSEAPLPTPEVYPIVYVALAALNSLFTLARAFLFAKGGLVAAKVVHNKLVLGRPCWFLGNTPVIRLNTPPSVFFLFFFFYLFLFFFYSILQTSQLNNQCQIFLLRYHSTGACSQSIFIGRLLHR